MIKGLSVVAALALIGGCSSSASTSGGATTTGPTTDSSLAADATTTVPATSAPATAPATVPATVPATLPATTTTIALEPLLLRSDGLGPFNFGPASLADVVAALTARFGPPARNDAVHYSDDSHLGDGYYESPVPPNFMDFTFEYGQTVCWSGDFCAEFGGNSAAGVSFVGWQYSGPPHMLASSSNLTIGAKWEDFPSMIVGATCYTTGGGTHHGILMVLTVAGGWDWLVSDGAGGYIENLPDRHITRVSF